MEVMNEANLDDRLRADGETEVPVGLVPDPSSAVEGEFRLADGRCLAFCQYGALDGDPVFFFHGWPGSRLDFAPNAAAAAESGVRVIAVDRPGIGRSDPQPRRSVLDWPADVAAHEE